MLPGAEVSSAGGPAGKSLPHVRSLSHLHLDDEANDRSNLHSVIMKINIFLVQDEMPG